MATLYSYFIIACCYFILITVLFRLFFTNRKKSSIKLLSRISMKRKRVQALLSAVPRRLKLYIGGKN